MNKITSILKTNASPLRGISILFFMSSVFVLLSACEVQSEIAPSDIPLQELEDTSVTINATSEPAILELTNEPKRATVVSLPFTTITPTAVDSTPTLIPTASSMPTETLSAEEINQKWQMIDTLVETIMVSNSGCQLPCWWGIEPGDFETDSRQIFDAINSSGWVNSNVQWGDLQQNGFFKHIYRNDLGDDIYIGFAIKLLVQNNSIRVIEVSVGRSVAFDTLSPEYVEIGERLIRDWEHYSAHNLFNTYGEPDSIYLLPRNIADGENFYYELNIYYSNLGIVASYSSPLLFNDNGERELCLNMFDMDSVQLYLFNPAVKPSNSYFQATYTLWPLATVLEPEKSQIIERNDVQTLTGMNIDEFVAFILNNENDANCFSISN